MKVFVDGKMENVDLNRMSRALMQRIATARVRCATVSRMLDVFAKGVNARYQLVVGLWVLSFEKIAVSVGKTTAKMKERVCGTMDGAMSPMKWGIIATLQMIAKQL